MKLAKYTAFISIILLILGNITFWLIAPRVFSKGPIFSSAAMQKTEVIGIYISVFFFIALFLLLLSVVVRIKYRVWDKLFIVNVLLLLFSLPLIRVSINRTQLLIYKFQPSAGIVQISSDISSWKKYTNSEAGYQILLPPEMEEHQKSYTNIKTGAYLAKGQPFDFTSFIPKELIYSKKKYEQFEIFIGVHLNEEKLTPSIFEQKKVQWDRESLKYYEVIKKESVSVAGIQAVRDQVVVKDRMGWGRYIRLFIPHNNRMIILIGLVGNEKEIIPYYYSIFDLIVSNFTLQ